jgi:hypothetical protein
MVGFPEGSTGSWSGRLRPDAKKIRTQEHHAGIAC